MTEQEFVDFASEKLENSFPKGRCQERGHALVLIGEILFELKKKGIVHE